MFYALPAETVFEAKERTRRATRYLFLLLLTLYVLFANFLAAVVFYFLGRVHLAEIGSREAWIFWTTLAAATVAIFHFFSARSKSLENLLGRLGAKDADPKDDYHASFIQLVEEMESAAGLHGIRPVVLNSAGCNAFSIQDGKGRCAIGVTEGLLAKLTRPELSSVLAHEAAHLIHEDSRLVTTTCFLFGVFGEINSTLSRVLTGASRTSYGWTSSRDRRGGGGIGAVVFVLWAVSGVGFLLTKLISMAISREREYSADADGVQMCKDPLSLAESLDKISRKYRGEVLDVYSALFILNPSESSLDYQEGFLSDLFSNHPPVSKRLEKLLVWAKSDMKTLEQLDEKEETAKNPIPSPILAPEKTFMAYGENQWKGPYTALQMLSLGAVSPMTWVCPVGSQEVSKASEVPELIPLFQQRVQGSLSERHCPRCKVSLLMTSYQGAEVEQCSFCRGYLLRAGVLERMVAREERLFTADEIRKSKLWRNSQRGNLSQRDSFPEIHCPYCGEVMCKAIHSYLTQVVVDHCSSAACGALWCDGGELETIQSIIQDSRQDSIG